MGLFDRINKAWSGADFWDKKENQQQRDNFAAEDERKRREREARQQAQQAARERSRAQAQARPQAKNSTDAIRDLGFDVPKIDSPMQAIDNAPKQVYKPISQPQKPQQSNINRFRDIFDANTASDKYRREVQTGVPDTEHYGLYDKGRDISTGISRGIATVPSAGARIVTGLTQDVANLPSLAVRTVDWADRKRTGNRVDAWRGTQALEQTTEGLNELIFDPVNRAVDKSAEIIGGEGNTGGYQAAQIGGEIVGAAASFGTLGAVRASSKTSKLGKLTDLLQDALAKGRTDDAVEIVRAITKLETSASRAGTVSRQLGGENRVARILEDLTDNPFNLFKRGSTAGDVSKGDGAIQPTPPKAVDVPPEPKVTVAAGVNKSPTAVTTPKPGDIPTPTPAIPDTPPQSILPTPGQVDNAVPTQAPLAPQTIDPTIQKVADDIQRQVDESVIAQTPPARTTESAPLETPITKASKEAAPGQVISPEKVTTKQMTPDEMRAKGMDEEMIANVMARRANPEAVKAAPEPVKEVDPEVARAEAQAAKDAGVDVPKTKKTKAETVDEARAKARAKTIADEAKAELPRKPAQQLGDPEKIKTPAQVKAEKKKQAVADAISGKNEVSAKTELPSKPKKPTQAQLNEGAVHNTNPSTDKVSEAWKTKQRKAGATEKQIDSAVEKVEGKKVAPTATEKELAATRKENNRVGRENKKKAKAEGKDKQAAPNVTKALADDTAKTTSSPEEAASIGKRYAAQTKGVNIEEGMTKAHKQLDEVSDDGITEHVRKLLDESNEIDDAERVFNSIAISKRLDTMRQAAGSKGLKLDNDLIELADEVAQTQALTASNAGLINRLTQEIYKNVPAPVRVKKRLSELTKRFEDMKVEFKPSKADEDKLVKLTDEFDKASTEMAGYQDELNAARGDYNGKTTPKEGDKLFKKHKQLEADHIKAQEEAVAKSLAFNDKLKSILPEIPKKEKMKQAAINAPDHVGNYLRLSMLSGLSGRIRDAGSTAINVADQSIVDLVASTIGKGTNKFLGTNVIDSYGSTTATKKGITGAWDKIKASWSGKPTLDEATGRTSTNSRAELARKKDSITSFGVDHGSKGSKWNIPKKAITTGVQLPTDASVGLFHKRLYTLGEVEARAQGITNKKQIKQFAEMFMDNPTEKAAVEAGQVWLKSSGMQKNKLSKKLTKVADDLERWGNKATGSDGEKLSTAQRVARKSLAVIVRTTTIPFVQYTGGSTHAMLMSQNPVSNLNQLRKAHKAGDTQKVIDELSRTTWNSGKIAALIGLMESNVIETSDTDADGVTSYNGPYVVRNGDYIPMGSYGIAGGAALISAHFLRRGYDKMKSGDVIGGMTDIVAGPPMAIVKASGLDNMMSGTNVLGGATENFEQSNSDSEMTPGDVAVTVGAGLVGDVGSQAVPAASRDLNVLADANDELNPTHEKPDTSGKDPITGKVDPVRKAGAQIVSGIPYLSQQLPRKSGELARDFQGRVYNANTQSEQQKAEIAKGESEKQTTIQRGQSLFNDSNLTNLLSEETRAIHDKYKGDISKASEDDMDDIWKDVKGKKDALIDDGSYDSYAKILQYELDEKVAKGGLTKNDREESERNISRAKLAGKNKIDSEVYRLYTGTGTAEGGGISSSEFNKMMDPDDPLYDQDTAEQLWFLDELFTEAGISANTNGINPYTRPKYKRPKDGWSSGGSGSGSGKQKTIATNASSLGTFGKPGSPSQGYKGLSTQIAKIQSNRTTQTSKTNLKKKISVQKGVRL